MNLIQILATQSWVERLAWTLLHFLWQGLFIAIVYAAARSWSARTMGPNVRYLLACAALTTMAVAPPLTWLSLSQPTAESIAGTFAAPLSAARTEPARVISMLYPRNADPAVPGPYLAWVVAIWWTGAAAFSLRLLAGWRIAGRLRSSMARPASAEWQRTLHRLKVQVSVSRPVRLLVSGALHAPAAIGWLRPVVLVPAGALAGLPPAQIEALLIHELAHIRRHDYLVHILQSAVEAIFFYHPAVWWISSHMRAERELCCDDVVVSLSGDAATYARALAEFDSAARIQPAVMAANGGSVAARIARLLGQPSRTRRVPRSPGTGLALILLTATAWAVFAQATVRPRFEVASIKPSVSRSIMNVRALPGRLTADASLLVLMQYAYGVQPFQIVGPSGWPPSGRYEIEATASGAASRDRVFLMLQSLLEDRFQLKMHRETRGLPVYALVTARGGLKLPAPKEGACVEAAANASPEWAGGRMAAPGELPPGAVQCGSVALGLGPAGARMQGEKVAMPELVRRLSLILDRSVVDRTGFTGRFDLQIDFIPDENTPAMPPPPPGADTSGITLSQALRQQLGLQLESARGPVEVIVVDHAERPSGN